MSECGNGSSHTPNVLHKFAQTAWCGEIHSDTPMCDVYQRLSERNLQSTSLAETGKRLRPSVLRRGSIVNWNYPNGVE